MTYFRHLLLVAFVAAGSGCDFNIEDPNRVGEDAVYNTRDGLVSAAIGLQQLYNVGALDDVYARADDDRVGDDAGGARASEFGLSNPLHGGGFGGVTGGADGAFDSL